MHQSHIGICLRGIKLVNPRPIRRFLKFLSFSMAALLNNSKNSNTSVASRGADMPRSRNKFLPSIFEERQDEKIQDFRKALQISVVAVRSSVHDGQGADENILQEQLGPRCRTVNSMRKTLVRSFSANRMEHNNQWRTKHQNSAFGGGNRLNSSLLGGNRSFGQRKMTSPGVNRGRAMDMPEVIDLTNLEEVKNVAKRFFEEELKMDLSDPRFNKPEDFITSLHWKAERKFSYGELWQCRRNPLSPTALLNSPDIFPPTPNMSSKNQAPTNVNKTNQGGLYEKLKPFPQLQSKYFQVCYSKPKTAVNGNTQKNALTASFKEQKDCSLKRGRQRILNPIKRDVQKSKDVLRRRAQHQNKILGQKQVAEKNY